MVLAACSSSSTSSTGGGGGGGSSSASSAAKKTVKVGLAYDVGGRGDKSFNDLAAAGLEKAKADLNIQTKELSAVQGESDQQKADRLDAARHVRLQPDHRGRLRVRHRVGQGSAQVPECPLRDRRRQQHQRSRTSRAWCSPRTQSSFLVGVAAALATKTKNVGFIGGVRHSADPEVPGRLRRRVSRRSTRRSRCRSRTSRRPPDFSGFNDPAKGKVIAEGQYDNGARRRLPRGRRFGQWSVPAAKEKNKLAIGVDSDQYQTRAGRREDADPDLGAQGRRHRGVQLHRGGRERQVQARLHPLRPEGRTASATRRRTR